jgi:Ca2+-binding RTX toxin-like protein
LLAFHVGEDGTVYLVSRSFDGVQFRRFAPDGAIAATSGALEAAIPAWQNGYFPQQIELQPDGKVLAIGPAFPTDDSGTVVNGWNVVRLYGDGQIDTTYGAGGIALPRFAFTGHAVVQGDGKLLVAGDRFGPDGPEVGRIDSGDLGVGVIRLNRKGTLLVYGTSKGENISVGIRGRDGKFVARVGNLAVGFAPSRIKRIAIFAGAGNDVVTIGNGVKGAYAQGDDGADILNGGAGDDVLVGGLQPDQLFGFDGNDKLAGEGGNDYLLGGAGKDDLFGQGGHDTLSGAGGNDRLFGGGDSDRCLGGNGTDAAAMSTEDEFSSIERFLDSP